MERGWHCEYYQVKILLLILNLQLKLEMHLSIYRKKKDINAIVHAHPVFASLFTAIKAKINTNLTAEAKAILGDPLFVKYALMGSAALAELRLRIFLNPIFFFLKIMEFLQPDQIFFRHLTRLKFLKMLQK